MPTINLITSVSACWGTRARAYKSTHNGASLLKGYLTIRVIACSAGVFLVGESCLFMFVLREHYTMNCCRGILQRVKIVTLRVGARVKEGKRGGLLLLTRPIFSPLFEFQHALLPAKHSCT